MSFDNTDNLVNNKINKEIEEINKNININPNQKEMDQNIQDFIDDYIRKHKWQKRMNYFKKISKIAAIILFSIIILSTILLSTVDALRVVFLNMFIEEKEDYLKMTVEKDELSNESIEILLNSEKLKNCYIPSYIPEKFTIEKIISADNAITIIFNDTNLNHLIFEQSKDLNKVYMVDSEDVYTEKISIRGHKAMLIIKDKITTILWQNNEGVFNVCGQLDRDEILKFCEGLYLK